MWPEVLILVTSICLAPKVGSGACSKSLVQYYEINPELKQVVVIQERRLKLITKESPILFNYVIAPTVGMIVAGTYVVRLNKDTIIILENHKEKLGATYRWTFP